MMMRKLSIAVALCAGTLLFATSANAQSGGEKTYKTKCASCHGPDGKGETAAGKASKARDFCSAEVKKETDEDWTGIIVKGKNKMPGYDKKLTDGEVKEVVAYIRSLCK
jgi:mono/diheme cytochrome c family protein